MSEQKTGKREDRKTRIPMSVIATAANKSQPNSLIFVKDERMSGRH
jgi:hypothetical protein